MLRPLALLALPSATLAGLLLAEDFSCASVGCNATGGITNYSYWRWSTTGSAQSFMRIGPARDGRAGNEVDFSVDYCPPPSPNPEHLGCYRSELALQRAVQHLGTLVDWKLKAVRGPDGAMHPASSERWFGFSNRLLNFSWVTASFPSYDGLNGPSFQLHGESSKWAPSKHSGHPVLNLQVDSTGCAQGNASCPVWTIGISAGGKPNLNCSENYDACYRLGPALVPGSPHGFASWQDWVIMWRGSPLASAGYLAVWRNGELVLPKVTLATAYNDKQPPYIKFGVYHSQWKDEGRAPAYARSSSLAYGGLRVGDEHSSFAEVSTKQ